MGESTQTLQKCSGGFIPANFADQADVYN